MRRKALHKSAEFEPPVSLPVVLKGSMPSSSKQFIKTVHQNSSSKQVIKTGHLSSLPKRQIETACHYWLASSPSSAILLTDSLNPLSWCFLWRAQPIDKR